MTEKQKLTANPDILITGRHIEFVTGYSIEECKQHIQDLQTVGIYAYNKTEVETLGIGHGLVRFNIHRRVNNAIGKTKAHVHIAGSLNQQLEDEPVIVSAKGPEKYAVIETLFSMFIILFFCSVLGSVPLSSPYLLGLIGLVALGFFIGDKEHRRKVNYAHKLLVNTLYIPSKEDRKQKLK